jgi:hypothetical protein
MAGFGCFLRKKGLGPLGVILQRYFERCSVCIEFIVGCEFGGTKS